MRVIRLAISRVPARYGQRLAISRVPARCVRQAKSRGRVMGVTRRQRSLVLAASPAKLPRVRKKPAKPRRVLTNLEKAVPARINSSPELPHAKPPRRRSLTNNS
ncbi:MAG: hypothetical protein ACOZF2_09350 [Thermodesulfobacteriota bacterium]